MEPGKTVDKSHIPNENIIRLVKNSAFVFLARITDMGVAVISTALIARYLGVTDFGYYAFVMAITLMLIPFTDFGFERIVTREIAGNKKLAERYLGSSVIARSFFSVIIVVAIYGITVIFDWDKKIIEAIYISTLTQLCVSMGMLAIGTFRAFEKMEYELLLNFIYNIVYLSLLIFVIRSDLGFLYIFVARFLASLINMSTLMTFAVHKFVKPILKIDIKLIAYLFREAMPLGMFALLFTASMRVDVYILNYFRGPYDVSLFEAAHRIILQLQVIPLSIVLALFPYFARLSKKSKDSLSFSFYKSFKYMLIISLPLPVLLTMSSNPIISLLYGNAFSDASLSLNLLSWTLPFLFLISLQSFVLTSEGKQILNTISAGIGFMTKLILDILLVQEYGYLGASFATLISYIILFALLLYFVFKTIRVPPLSEIVSKPLLSIGGIGILSYFIYNKAGLNLIMVKWAAVIATYITVMYFLKAFTPDELSIFKSILLKHRCNKWRIL